jgi:two-component system chemotaxis response regulator CheY
MIRLTPFKVRRSNAPRDTVTVAPEPEPPPADPNAQRILIVDDDAVFVKATWMKLRSAGFNVMVARDSSEAIAALSEYPTDVVLMDVNFPPDVSHGGMGSWDGFQLMYWLRGLATAKAPRFIFVSNSDSPAFRAQAQRLGAVAYFRKPVSNEDLLTALNQGTDRYSAA